ncbi:MAG: hypothetical protein ACRYGP_17565 [Janthinobacterium lividum]
MSAAQHSADMIRMPVRLRMVRPEVGENHHRVSMPGNPATALGCLLEAGTIDAGQHFAALAYAALRRRYDRSGGAMRSWRDRSGMSDEVWQAVKRDHARLIRAAGAERFVLDRLCLDDDAPMACELERVGMALERVAEGLGAATA